ncbi:MAG: class I SAM-dependent methyltransferase, partial [Acidobacteriota bacterium]|nr:class I SAM-dependent methyltransferase [Acidobacteriota bacterium]
ADAERYREIHLERIATSLALVPPPAGTGRVLELGAYMQMTPALHNVLGYREVRAAYLGAPGTVDTKTASVNGQTIFECQCDLFDAERDPYPYPDGYFDCVLACEIFEHMLHDPMHLLFETRRVLAGQGTLLITTPNVASATAVARVLEMSGNPQLYSKYAADDVGHVREYTPAELTEALEAAGFEIVSLFTRNAPGYNSASWVTGLLQDLHQPTQFRGEQMFCLARKQTAPKLKRRPEFLYD